MQNRASALALALALALTLALTLARPFASECLRPQMMLLLHAQQSTASVQIELIINQSTLLSPL
jgi:hypothetical protein